MRIHRHLGAAVAAAALAALTVLPASADSPSVLTYGGVGGSPVAVGDQLTAALQSGTVATLYSTSDGGTGVQCSTSSFNATVTSNPSAPGTAVETLGSQTFDNCTAVNIPGVMDVSSITVDNLSYTNNVSDASGNPVTLSPGSTGPIQTTINLDTLLGSVSCTYQASPSSLSGTTDNTAQAISFANQSFTLSSGPGTCFSAGYFTASYGPVQDTSQAGSPAVYVN
ncbi:Tat pathway signal sequence domain protein [Kitasatospora sp. LaBMicrA B282]|uniref:Tat pathway signal sequence domain protein n=1 Tax=Kitasatospora sp. LaBMicrA B282 TaxID=3420949 RepID=UPI003D14863F